MDPRGIFISFYTIVRKDLLRIFRIWPQTFLPSVVTSVLYFLIFGAFLGSRIGMVAGVPYIMFVVPGLVMLAVVTNAYSNTAMVMFSSKFFARNIDELLASPTPPWIIVAGFVSTGIVRGVLVGVLVLGVSLFFTHLVIHSIGVVIGYLILTSLIFSSAGLLNGVFAKTIDGINIVPTFVLTPLVYLGGIFYSVQTLPGFWQSITHLNPIFYLINGFRFGFLGFADISIFVCTGILAALSAVLAGLDWYLVKIGLGLRQ